VVFSLDFQFEIKCTLLLEIISRVSGLFFFDEMHSGPAAEAASCQSDIGSETSV